MNRLLGAVAVTGKIGRPPRRLSITAKTLTELKPGTTLVAPTAPLRPRDRQSGGPGNVVELPLSVD
jgi:hypothetical protein